MPQSELARSLPTRPSSRRASASVEPWSASSSQARYRVQSRLWSQSIKCEGRSSRRFASFSRAVTSRCVSSRWDYSLFVRGNRADDGRAVRRSSTSPPSRVRSTFSSPNCALGAPRGSKLSTWRPSTRKVFSIRPTRRSTLFRSGRLRAQSPSTASTASSCYVMTVRRSCNSASLRSFY